MSVSVRRDCSVSSSLRSKQLFHYSRPSRTSSNGLALSSNALLCRLHGIFRRCASRKWCLMTESETHSSLNKSPSDIFIERSGVPRWMRLELIKSDVKRNWSSRWDAVVRRSLTEDHEGNLRRAKVEENEFRGLFMMDDSIRPLNHCEQVSLFSWHRPICSVWLDSFVRIRGSSLFFCCSSTPVSNTVPTNIYFLSRTIVITHSIFGRVFSNGMPSFVMLSPPSTWWPFCCFTFNCMTDRCWIFFCCSSVFSC